MIKFHSAAGRASVRDAIDDLIDSASARLRAAVCFFTPAGVRVMARHADKLRLSESYFVVSVSPPTDLEAVSSLDSLAPRSVYIHLGGVTPEEPGVGQALMHSKILLAEDVQKGRLWVGSHNMTASAIEGANFEAAFEIESSMTEAHMIAAARHLDACRDSAELFDRSQMERYREIQGRKRTTLGEPAEIVVILAEAAERPNTTPYSVALTITSDKLDNILAPERDVHLYLYPPGALSSGKAPHNGVQAWTGKVTGANRTDKNPRNRGILVGLSEAEFQIVIDDPPPTFRRGHGTTPPPVTQAVLRLDQPLHPKTEVYSVSKDPILRPRKLLSDADESRSRVAADMKDLFTRESVDGVELIYRPVTHFKRQAQIEVYEYAETTSTSLSGMLPISTAADVELDVKLRKSDDPNAPYFFLSRYHFRQR